MSRWEAPAKLNLWLRVAPPADGGYHPVDSLVQTVELCDVLEIAEGEEDRLEVDGAELPTDGDNLVWRAVEALGPPRPALHLRLVKRIPVCAGLGGGSSDAAAALLAVAELTGRPRAAVAGRAASVGADVPYFLTGGTAHMSGFGERIEPAERLEGFAVALVVPPFELATPEVYRRWDELEGPVGPELSGRGLPPALRTHAPLVNDLTPAATDLRPELADWIADLSGIWGRPVGMSGSGPSLFACFADLDEAAAGAAEAPPAARAAVAADLRSTGAAPT